MQILYSVLTSVLIGYLFSRVNLFRLKKLTTDKFILFALAWLVSVLVINRFFDPNLFYSNDQLVFKKALISLDEWLFEDARSFDFRYLGQTLFAFILYKFLFFDPLISLKAINFFCMTLVFRIFFDFVERLENVKTLNFQVRLILPFLLAPSFILFSAIGNRDIIIVLTFLVSVLAIYKKENFLFFVFAFWGLTLRPHLFFLLIIAYAFGRMIPGKLILNFIFSIACFFILFFLAALIIPFFLSFLGYHNLDFSPNIKIMSIILFPLLNFLNLGFVLGDETTSSNSIVKLFVYRIILYEGWIYLLLLINIIFIKIKYWSLLSNRAQLLLKILVFCFIIYSLLGLNLSFFSMRQTLPFYTSFVFLFLIWVYEIRKKLSKIL